MTPTITAELLKTLGLREGSMRHARLIKNAGWYDFHGVKLGWGDVGEKDVEALKQGLPPDEPLFLVGEQEAYWNYVQVNTGIPYLNKMDPKEEHPGFRYVMKHARFIMFEGEVYTMDRRPHEFGKTLDMGGYCTIMCVAIDPEVMRQKLVKFGGMLRAV